MTIILRQTKGSALTHAELDGNFTDLDTRLIDVFTLPVGFGILTPDGSFHIQTASAGVVTASPFADDLVVENNVTGGISILTPDSVFSILSFGSPSNNIGAFMQWNYATTALAFGANTATGKIKFQINGVDAMHIASTRDVGIGTFTPDGRLHVFTAEAGIVTAHAIANDLVVENSTNGGMSILVPDASQASIYFGSPTSNLGAQIWWNYNTGLMVIGSAKVGAEVILSSGNSVEAIRIDSSQNVGMGISTPDGKLHSHSGSAGTVTAHIDANEIIAENSANAGISILAPDAANSSIYFGSPTDNLGSLLQWNYNGGLFSIGTSKTGANINFLSGSSVLAMTIDSLQKIGMGISTPDGTLHVHTASAGAVTANNIADELVVENTGNGGISVLTEDASVGVIAFGSPSDNFGAYFNWTYGSLLCTLGTATAGAKVEIYSGNDVLAMTIASDQGAFMTGATGGSQGSGTFNAQAVYDDGVLLTCYVPHYIVDGKIDLNEWDDLVPNKKDEKTFHLPARRFALDVENRIDVKKFTHFWKTKKHLPTMPSKEEWIEEGPKPTGEMIQMLWETVELQAAHIDQLLTRIEALEKAA